MPSNPPVNETSARPAPKERPDEAAPPSADDSGGALATEEDIGTEGAGTEPPADEARDAPRGSRPG